LTCKQTRTLRDQEETILDLQRELALTYDQIVKLKAEKSSSIKCNCSSKHWTVVKDKSQRRNKSLCSTDDLNFNVELSNKFEALTMSEPAGVAQLKKKEDGKRIVNRNNSSNNKCNTKKVLLVGSSHVRGLCEHLHSILGDEYMVTNIFKPNATHGNVVVELKELSKDFTKDHVIIVGGPGNSLDRDLNYKIENYINNLYFGILGWLYSNIHNHRLRHKRTIT
jgi:hypothetical protein